MEQKTVSRNLIGELRKEQWKKKIIICTFFETFFVKKTKIDATLYSIFVLHFIFRYFGGHREPGNDLSASNSTETAGPPSPKKPKASLLTVEPHEISPEGHQKEEPSTEEKHNVDEQPQVYMNEYNEVFVKVSILASKKAHEALRLIASFPSKTIIAAAQLLQQLKSSQWKLSAGFSFFCIHLNSFKALQRSFFSR